MKCIDPNYNIPNEEGVYLVKNLGNEEEMDVYVHPIKGLCCYSEDVGCEPSELFDSTNCHISVNSVGLEFITKLRDFNKNAME